MHCDDFLISAQRSIARYKTSKEDLEVRDAISRAYYFAFHKATSILPFLNLSIANNGLSGSHKLLANRYQQAASKNLKAIGLALDAAHKLRCLADYDLEEAVSLELANQQISKCSGISSRLDQEVVSRAKAV